MEKSKKWNFRPTLFPRVYTEGALLYLLAIKKREYLLLTADKRSLCKIEQEPKKSGGYRTIYKPAYKLKFFLKRLNSRYLSRLDFPNFVHCGPEGRSIVTAAKGHDMYEYHLALDIAAFFDSVSEKTLMKVLKGIGLNKDIATFLLRSSIEDNQLPQGFPTSSLLSSLVVSYLLQDFYKQVAGQPVLLSIYADDILVSANDKETLIKAKFYIKETLEPEGLNLKDEKEQHVRKGEKFTWLGLQLHPWIALPRKDLLSLEKNVYEFKTLGLIPKDFVPKKSVKSPEELREAYAASLKGKIVFAGSINRSRILSKARTKLGS